jgi:hypothetical protein
MADTAEILSEEETMVLDIYRIRFVNKGVGLTYDVLASELKPYPGFDLDSALGSLVAKGLLQNPHFYKRFYILTAKGKEAIAEHLGAF